LTVFVKNINLTRIIDEKTSENIQEELQRILVQIMHLMQIVNGKVDA
jgi:formiminotetrahydrofolate cyclodeaminase